METFTIVALVGIAIGLAGLAYNYKKKRDAKKAAAVRPPTTLPKPTPVVLEKTKKTAK